MEDEVNYSTVVFKKNQPPKENKEEETVYSEVKRKEPATVVSKDKAATRSHSRLLLVCLGMLCVLLILGIAIIIYISVMMNEQQAHLRKVTADSERLIVEKRILENRTEELSKDRDYHNRMLEVILKFDNFPVKDFCPDKKCQPCRKGWVQHQNKCYLFYNEDMPWKTWKDSRKSCKDIQSDLVVIDTFQEQQFISGHIEPYFDEYHGYHIGLRKQDSNWVWVDGRKDTLGYWIKGVFGTPGLYALMIPGRNLTESWNTTDEKFENKFICEHDTVFIRSF